MFSSILFSFYCLVRSRRNKLVQNQPNRHQVTAFGTKVGQDIGRWCMRGEFHEMVKKYGVDLGSQKDWQHHPAQQFRTGPSVGDRQVKDNGIQNPKPIGVYAGSLDEPFGTLVKQRIVFDREIDGFFDKGRAAGGI